MANYKKLVREVFRTNIFTRDKHKCVMCGKPAIDAHHITDRHNMPDGGYTLDNGIALCGECHLKAEVYHQSNGREWPKGFHPNDLYARIRKTIR